MFDIRSSDLFILQLKVSTLLPNTPHFLHIPSPWKSPFYSVSLSFPFYLVVVIAVVFKIPHINGTKQQYLYFCLAYILLYI